MIAKNLLLPIKKLWQEPIMSWAFRLGISVTVPLVLGLILGHMHAFFWVALGAQCVAFIEMRGGFGNVLRILLSASAFALLTSILGSVSGNYLILHITLMFVVGFVSALFKNLGERGAGLSLSVYIFFIVTSSRPLTSFDEIWQLSELVWFGALWSVLLAVLWMLLEKQGRPVRKTISGVFHQMSVLTQKARSGFGGEGVFIPLRDLYLQENEIRSSLNLSIELFDSNDKEVANNKQLAMIRKIAGLLNIQLLEILEHTQNLKRTRREDNSGIHIHSLLRIWEQIFDLMDQYIYGLKIEDKILLQTRLDRLEGITQAIEDAPFASEGLRALMQKILKLSKRMSRLVDRLLDIIAEKKEKRVFQSYSFSKTLAILHPKSFGNEFANFFRMEKNLTMYALRVGIAVTIGAIIDHLFFDSYGYWIPFTSIIVAQPYIGATMKKGLERSGGTFLGIIVGFFIFHSATGNYVNVVMVFVSSILIIYFLKKKYSISSFFITLSLLGLLSLSNMNHDNVLWIRLLCTIIGSGISIGLSFLFISTWDVTMVPIHFREAIKANYNYLKESPVMGGKLTNWMKYKRLAESANAKLFDSYTRWINEPSMKKDRKLISNYFTKIAHIIRITKEQNNLNTEWELVHNKEMNETATFRDTINLFEQILIELGELKPEEMMGSSYKHSLKAVNEHQRIYLEKLNLELKALRGNLTSIK